MEDEEERFRRKIGPGSHEVRLHSLSSTRRPLKSWTPAAVFASFVVIVLCGSVVSWLDIFVFPGISSRQMITAKGGQGEPPQKMEFPLNCTNSSTVPQTCPKNYPTKHEPEESYAVVCPEYFRWIHEDLRPWKSLGITREMMERTKNIAHFRLVIKNGKAYIEHYKRPFQTRDLGTIWGILQLLRLYPGKVPDLELMFYCNDRPVIMKNHYQGPNAGSPPPLFHYCGNGTSLDILFPDWSFWGWHEVNIRTWTNTYQAIKEKAKEMEWKDRIPYAYWKGNPGVSANRQGLMTCNATEEHDWNARLYVQNWAAESREGFKESRLEDQCIHRYKIFVEGKAWSVSDKYILACDSTTLLIEPVYHDFFLRGMLPMEHYWPVRLNNKCRDIKFAVEWGNNHIKEAQAIGERGSRFLGENLKMKYVYDYMLHLLVEYAKLLKFRPEVPVGATEYCAEAMACPFGGLFRMNMEDSMVKSPSESLPCALPPPYDPRELQGFMERKRNYTRLLEELGG
ncbi:O-glucosyltransferase rumi homolog [Eucalyptus grandis]|uniref:O-glucosyltransferase rumi homolog n=1 Tax=Eucalyptus grandis TaxID=71139 RepID=UPI00192EEF1D|nr:O-glucosyltransferase rumi homolog [Eucalyptus grandis]